MQELRLKIFQNTWDNMKIIPFFDITWTDDFKQIAIIPTIFITKSYGTRYNFGINFLCFDFGLWILIRK